MQFDRHDKLSPQTFFRETCYTYGHRNVIRAVAAAPILTVKAGLADNAECDTGYGGADRGASDGRGHLRCRH